MLAKLAKLALAAATIALFTTGITTAADAQQIQRRCLKAKDPVKCTCFVSNNGQIVWAGGQRRARIHSMGELDGYIACMKRHGRA